MSNASGINGTSHKKRPEYFFYPGQKVIVIDDLYLHERAVGMGFKKGIVVTVREIATDIDWDDEGGGIRLVEFKMWKGWGGMEVAFKRRRFMPASENETWN